MIIQVFVVLLCLLLLIWVLIVDDYVMVCEGFVVIIGCQLDMFVVGEVVDGQVCVEWWLEYCFDVILFDLCMLIFDGVGVIEVIWCEDVVVWFIVLIMFDIDYDIICVIVVGVKGYMFKDVQCEELFECICVVYVGEVCILLLLLVKFVFIVSGEVLIGCEFEVFILLVWGCSNKDIVWQLLIGEIIVKLYLCSIFIKLQVLSCIEVFIEVSWCGLIWFQLIWLVVGGWRCVLFERRSFLLFVGVVEFFVDGLMVCQFVCGDSLR